MSKKDTFTASPVPFKSSVNIEAITHQILNFSVPEGLAGHYSFFAIFNEAGSDISDLTHSLRSTKYPCIIDLTNFTQDFFSSSRRINRHIAGYETIYATQKMEKKTSKMLN